MAGPKAHFIHIFSLEEQQMPFCLNWSLQNMLATPTTIQTFPHETKAIFQNKMAEKLYLDKQLRNFIPYNFKNVKGLG